MVRPGDRYHPGQSSWWVLPGLAPGQDDLFVRKTSCDGFLDTELDALLKSAGIERLIVTGYAADCCVDTTVRSTLARRYRTVVPADGHTTADRPHLSAQKIIEHHNAIWADFLSPVGPAASGRARRSRRKIRCPIHTVKLLNESGKTLQLLRKPIDRSVAGDLFTRHGTKPPLRRKGTYGLCN